MSNSTLVKQVTSAQIRSDLPEFFAGDSISVTYTTDGERTQTFKGIVLYVKGTGVSRTFCVRKIAVDGIGVEKIMPINSPIIKKIKVEKAGDVRRAKLYYMRNRKGKSALKIKGGKRDISVKMEVPQEVKPEVEEVVANAE